jgi:MFS family permease
LWLISLLFACFNYAYVSFITWVPAFLDGVRGMSLENASFAVSTLSMVAIVSCPLAGWISDRLGSRKVILTLPMILMGVLIPFTYGLRIELYLPLLIVLGFVSGFAPTGVFSAAAEIVGDERLGGMAMAIVLLGQNVGMLIGPFIFGTLVESPGGWEMAFWTLAPLCGAGAVAGVLSRVR